MASNVEIGRHDLGQRRGMPLIVEVLGVEDLAVGGVEQEGGAGVRDRARRQRENLQGGSEKPDAHGSSRAGCVSFAPIIFARPGGNPRAAQCPRCVRLSLMCAQATHALARARPLAIQAQRPGRCRFRLEALDMTAPSRA